MSIDEYKESIKKDVLALVDKLDCNSLKILYSVCLDIVAKYEKEDLE